ncbi:MAG: hypothetical protein H6814_10920 [Phycisphaeraceae bacterium]|nr:hypothetical protein [Phycisphaeraceae bacterium]
MPLNPLHHLNTTIAAEPQQGGSTLVQMMAALGVLLLCFTMLSLLRRRLRRQAHQRGLTVKERIQAVRSQAQGGAPRADRPRSLAAGAATRATIESVMADAEELTRRLAAVMDNKAAALEILIERAGEAADRLERASGAQPHSQQSNPRRPPASPPSDPLSDEVYCLADQGRTAIEIAQQLDEPAGKVELILALRRGAAAASVISPN